MSLFSWITIDVVEHSQLEESTLSIRLYPITVACLHLLGQRRELRMLVMISAMQS